MHTSPDTEYTKQMVTTIMYFVYTIFSKICINVFSKLFLEYVVFTKLMTIQV